MRQNYLVDDDDYDDDADIIEPLPARFRRKYSEGDSDNQNNALAVPKPFATISNDDRPITPMKDKMIYDREYSSLDFKDGQF